MLPDWIWFFRNQVKWFSILTLQISILFCSGSNLLTINKVGQLSSLQSSLIAWVYFLKYNKKTVCRCFWSFLKSAWNPSKICLTKKLLLCIFTKFKSEKDVFKIKRLYRLYRLFHEILSHLLIWDQIVQTVYCIS